VHLTCLAILGYALAAAPAAPLPKSAGKAGDERPKIEAYLSSHDVASAAELRELSLTPGRPLLAIAADDRIPGLVRARAVAALRLYPSTETRSFLDRVLQAKAKTTDATDRLIVRRAAVALGWIAGPDACAQLALLFENVDTEVRVDAAIGLGLTRAADAPALLRKQLAVESVPRVRDQIQRQLRALGQPLPEPEQTPPRKEREPMRGGF
jgi:HEAT repeat protein